MAELSGVLSGLRASPLYKTAPLHVTDQAPFLNMAVSGCFNALDGSSAARNSAAQKLLVLIKAIETRHGRNRSAERRWGERSLDIDILLFGDTVLSIAEPDLVIPHPRLKERAFALRPLLDLWPGAVEPGTGLAYREILAGLGGQEITPLTKPYLPEYTKKDGKPCHPDNGYISNR
ncbi:hypothetical protein AGMMS50230_14480 [Spirochaetia bacterium]|nr:hypothetical protein AGMMS50230_14480 [Spirochaetia bacterium]